MPRVPAYGPQKVEEAGLPSARLTARFTPESVGAGIGRGITRVGEGLQKIEKEQKRKADEILILDADRELGEYETQVLYNPETGAMNKQGKDTFEMPEIVNQGYRDKLAEIEGRLTNDEQKLAFRKLAVSRERGINRTVQRHVSGEIKKFEDESTESYVKNARANAALNYTDPKRVGVEIARQRMAISAHADRNGFPAPRTKQLIENAESQTHVAVLERMLANDQDQLATAYFKDNKGGITGEHIAKVEKFLEAGTLRGDSQRKTDEILSSIEDPSQQLDKARGIKDTKVRDEVVRRVTARQAEKAKVQQQIQRQAKDDSWQVIAGEGSVDDIPVTTWARLSGPDQQQLVTYAKKQASGIEIETDWEAYYGLARLSPSELVGVNLNDHRNQLSNAEFKQVTGWQRGYRDASKKGVAPEGTTQQLINSAVDANPLSDKLKGEFTSRVYNTIDQEQQNLGRKLNTGERQAIIDNLIVEGELQRDYLWDPNKRVFEIETNEERRRFYVEDVPGGEREKIEAALGRAKLPVTDEAVMRMYNQKLQKQILKGQ